MSRDLAATPGFVTRMRATLRELFGIVPTLDLHGYGVRDAIEATEEFLRLAQSRHESQVQIIYGKGHGSPQGRGVLREVIPRWLDEHGQAFVERYERRPDARGGDGRIEVWLRPIADRVGDSNR